MKFGGNETVLLALISLLKGEGVYSRARTSVIFEMKKLSQFSPLFFVEGK